MTCNLFLNAIREYCNAFCIYIERTKPNRSISNAEQDVAILQVWQHCGKKSASTFSAANTMKRLGTRNRIEIYDCDASENVAANLAGHSTCRLCAKVEQSVCHVQDGIIAVSRCCHMTASCTQIIQTLIDLTTNRALPVQLIVLQHQVMPCTCGVITVTGQIRSLHQ